MIGSWNASKSEAPQIGHYLWDISFLRPEIVFWEFPST
jgi:hypothetical protein